MTAAAPGGGGALGSWRERKGSPCVCVWGREMVGPTFGGGNGGPPRMEGGRRNLEGHAKWRSI
jgi:hypothetical protein